MAPDLTANEEIVALASMLVERQSLFARLGQSYFGSTKAYRDIYQALGYPKKLQFEDYYGRFRRQDIAGRIVAAPVEASWELDPVLKEDEEEGNTEFEQAWLDLEEKHRVLHYLQRLDLLSGIGQFGVLVLGFNDGANDQEVRNGSELLYLRPYMEASVKVAEWETDKRNPRYGLPLVYTIQTSEVTVGSMSAPGTLSVNFHHSRVLHVAEGALENDILGTSRLECVYNRLQDLDLLAGGSAEMYWRGALPGTVFKADPEAAFTPTAKAELQTEIEAFVHGLQRFLKLQGVEAQQLASQVTSPEGQARLLLDLISAATHIPKRILVGSERGELASVQDDANWARHVHHRRLKHVTPNILRPFVDRCLKYEILPQPADEDGYQVEWPDLQTQSDKEKADVGKVKTDTIVAYANAPTAQQVFPLEQFLVKILGMKKAEAEEVAQLAEEAAKEEEARMEEERKLQAEEARRQGTPPQPQPGHQPRPQPVAVGGR